MAGPTYYNFYVQVVDPDGEHGDWDGNADLVRAAILRTEAFSVVKVGDQFGVDGR